MYWGSGYKLGIWFQQYTRVLEESAQRGSPCPCHAGGAVGGGAQAQGDCLFCKRQPQWTGNKSQLAQVSGGVIQVPCAHLVTPCRPKQRASPGARKPRSTIAARLCAFPPPLDQARAPVLPRPQGACLPGALVCCEFGSYNLLGTNGGRCSI